MRTRGRGRCPYASTASLSRDTGAVGYTFPRAVPLKTAAFLVGLSRRHLRREIAQGHLPGFKLRWYTRLPDGRVYRRERWTIARRDLAEWVRRRCDPRAASAPPLSTDTWAGWLDCIVFTVPFVAGAVGVSDRYIRAEIAAGRLRAFRQVIYLKAWGKTWRRQRWMIPNSAYIEWLLERDDRARRRAAAGGPGAAHR